MPKPGTLKTLFNTLNPTTHKKVLPDADELAQLEHPNRKEKRALKAHKRKQRGTT